jgi:hypothetical protein
MKRQIREGGEALPYLKFSEVVLHTCGNYHLIDKMILIISMSVGDDPPVD